MKLLWVTPMPPRAQAPGAIPVILYSQLQALRQRHELTLLTVAGPEPGEREAAAVLRRAGIDVLAAERVEPRSWARWQRRWRWASAWLRGEWPWRSVWFWEPGIQRLLDQVSRERRFDVIAVEDNAMGIYDYPAGTPRVLAEHEVRRPRPMDWPAAGVLPGPRWALREVDWRRWPAYERRVWSKFDRVQVFTPRDAASLAEIAPELAGRVRVNPFGVEMPRLDEAAPACEEADSLLFIGNFTHPPNVDAAVWLAREILPRVQARRPAARLLLVGIFPPPAVQALAGPNVTVTGPVDDIAPFFRRAAVCIAPVRIGGGMRTKVLQAMAYGKAVVTTPRGAEGLSLGDCQPPLALAEDADGLARASWALLADEAARRRLGRAARNYAAEHFSPLAYVRRAEAVYAELLPARVPETVA